MKLGKSKLGLVLSIILFWIIGLPVLAKAVIINLRIIEASSGEIIPARVLLRASDGKCYHPLRAVLLPIGADLWFMSTGNDTLSLPAGNVLLRVERGKEYVRLKENINIVAEDAVEKTVVLQRWINMRELGYQCAENHLHRSPDDIAALCAAEDLDYGTVLQWWNRPRFGVPEGSGHLRNLQFAGVTIPTSIYDVEVEEAWGALYLISMPNPFPFLNDPRMPNLPAAQYGREKGALNCYQSGWSREVLVDALLGLVDVVNVCNNNFHLHRYQPRKTTAQNASESQGQMKPGLVGILYDASDLTRPASLWYLQGFNSDSLPRQKRHDFSAQWFGWLKAPADGLIQFFAEARNGLRLEISSEKVIDAWDDARSVSGKMEMQGGKLYPVEVSYRKINEPGYMRLYWSWDGQNKTAIPLSAAWFSPANDDTVRQQFNHEMRANWEDITFDVNSIIDIHQPVDIEQKRTELNLLIFGENQLSIDRQPDRIDQDIEDAEFDMILNLKQIDRLTIDMDYQMNSIIYHFIPITSNNELMIYHQGHDGKFSLGKNTISAFLQRGYHVIALSMPLLGMNRKPVVTLERFGKMIIASHAILAFLKPHSGHPLRYFLEPVNAAVNYAQSFHFIRINMIGISGGGWTTTVYAALDRRISNSYPVAGSLPIYLRTLDVTNSSSLGDYEQHVPEIYRIANYLELYIMGAYGEHRRQLQVLNEFDACCFSGTGYTTYRDEVKKRIKQFGNGSYDVFLDSTHHEHKISEKAMEVILMDLEGH